MTDVVLYPRFALPRLKEALPRLLQLAAGQTARLLNVADLAAPFQLSRPTIRDYVTLLEWNVETGSCFRPAEKN